MPSLTIEFGRDYLFEEVFPEPETAFAGVKAVFAKLTTRYLCFGEQGASLAAGQAATKPWAICIGTTKAWNPDDRGRVLNLVRMTTLRQGTPALASSDEERQQFAQWPFAVAVGDVYGVVDRPHVRSDLGMAVHPLLQSHDKVSPLTPERLPILAALHGWRITLADLPPLPVGVSLGSEFPTSLSVEEGRKFMTIVMDYERSAELADKAKADNRAANGGAYVCEGCDFRHEVRGLFDAHHRRPVHLGVRITTPSDLSVLCPTCHRVVHQLAPAPHLPMDVPALRLWRTNHAAGAEE